MRLFNAQVFDDFIKGTASTWYSSSELNKVLGGAELLAIQACTSGVTANSKLTVQVETSADNKNWVPTDSPEIDDQAIADDESYVGRREFGLLAHTRLKIYLGGTATPPECRLKLYVTGRVLAGQP